MSERLVMSVVALSAFCAQARPDWDERATTGALVAVTRAGWPWGRVLREVARMLADDDAAPGDLLVAARRPLERVVPEPGAHERGAAAARAALSQALGRPL